MPCALAFSGFRSRLRGRLSGSIPFGYPAGPSAAGNRAGGVAFRGRRRMPIRGRCRHVLKGRKTFNRVLVGRLPIRGRLRHGRTVAMMSGCKGRPAAISPRNEHQAYCQASSESSPSAVTPSCLRHRRHLAGSRESGHARLLKNCPGSAPGRFEGQAATVVPRSVRHLSSVELRSSR